MLTFPLRLLLVWAGLHGLALAQPASDTLHPLISGFIQDPHGSPLIDFSYAGFRNGSEWLELKTLQLPVFRVRDYNALPNDGRDDLRGIQRAVDAASAAGGGKVVFERGRYDLDVDSSGGFVHVSSSNIYLVGWGEESGGTEIYDHRPSPTPVATKPWLAGSIPSFALFAPRSGHDHPAVYSDPTNRVAQVSAAAARGARYLTVDVALFRSGQVLLLSQQEAPDTSLAYALAAPLTELGRRHRATAGPDSYKFLQLVRVDSVGQDGIFLDAPLLHDLRTEWTPTLWRIPGLLENVGAVSLRVTNGWREEFVHHKNGEHDNGFDAIKLEYVADAWLQGIVAFNTSAVVAMNHVLNASLVYCQVRGNPGHNGFTITGASTRNLLYRCRGGQAMHSFSISGAASANVVHDCHAQEPSALDLHAGLGISNLFDGIYGPAYAHGGSPRNLPPALGKGQVFWNWRVGRFEPYKGRPTNTLWSDTELPAPIAVGVVGMYGRPLYTIQNHQRHRLTPSLPSPHSLWRWQGQRRLGNRFPY